MIKAKMKHPVKGDIIVFGIDQQNVDLLKAGKPIDVTLDDMGIRAEIIIFYAPAMGDLIKAIQPMIDEDTEIHDYL